MGETLQRCQRLVKSNEAPGSAEIAFIRAVVSDTGARLGYLDAEISRLRDRLEQLTSERTQLSEYHSQYVPILSPLRRLPTEVLAEIFLRTLPSFHERSGDISDTQRSPWTVCQVSRRWRGIALSTPSLWTTVHIDFVHDEHQAHSDVEIQLQRSRTLNLEVHFFGRDEADPAEQLELFDLLSRHSARWETLNIQLSSALVPRLAQLRGRLPSLRRLWLQWDSEQMDAGVNSESRFVPILVPAHQLTTYRLHGPLKMHLHVLKLAPNIVEARIVTAFDEEPWPEPGPQTIELLHLQRLHVSDEGLLDYLRAPHLAEIGVELTMTNEYSTLVHRLGALFLRSTCAPEKLLLKAISSSASTSDILKKCPFITTIALTFFKDGTDAMEAHLTMLSDVSKSPHLREICFGALESMPIDYPLFLRMLKSRRESCLGAASFFAVEGPDPDPVTLAGLEELRDSGLDLRVDSGLEAQREIDAWDNDCLWNQ
ncbi:hypothetical protein FB45DRAFT_1127782 [Roridomyces roridus]|uniref:F-box domain-containing protein n=1 Tax=Roridomyces roridus TaxID=1738132 RepID=A0AAD7B3M0_9AGAR|nr:hypothetical protein FB45DRAFT_1127782 [Roridomyces roridus]